jgi:hypothetical protein
MKKIYKYRIEDSDKFKNEFTEIVDTTVDCKCNAIDTSLLKSEYFGKIESDKFTITHKSCEMLILGNIKDQKLTIEFNFPNRFNALFDIILFTLVGASIMYDINFYIGLAIVLFVIIQKFVIFSSEEQKKKEFLKKIEDIISRI